MSLTLSVIQGVQLSVLPTDAEGNPVPVDGMVSWASSDESVLSVVISADRWLAEVRAVAPGRAQIVVSADVRVGPGVAPITDVLEIDVIPAQAVSMNISAGRPYIA
jgi:hypothetical protein